MTELKRTSMIRRAMGAGQARLVVVGALLAGLFAGVGVFHASARVAVVRAGYELDQEQTRLKQLQRENEHLKLERATLRSAPRLEAIARARLGLQPPSAGQIQSVRKVAPAKAEKVGAVASAERIQDEE